MNNNFINKSYEHYKKTGNLKPLLKDIEFYCLNLCKKKGLTYYFFESDLWSSVLERIAIALPNYSQEKGTPYKFFSGLLHKHIFYYKIKKYRENKKKSSCKIENISVQTDFTEFNIHYIIEELKSLNTSDLEKKLGINKKEILNVVMSKIEKGEDLTKIKKILGESYEVDLLIIRIRKRIYEILS